MNWEIFSLAGYISALLWVCMPLFWMAHMLIRPRRWLGHVPLVLGVVALSLAMFNSKTHVARIKVDQSEAVEDQLAASELARQQVESERMAATADIRFAEDASGDRLDKAGLDNTDLAYIESFGKSKPDWKQQKQQRNEDSADPDDLESLIGGGKVEQEGIEVKDVQEPVELEPIFMSDEDKLTADRIDRFNLTMARLLLAASLLFVVVDYFRRLNVENEVYFPLPIPSAWANALTQRPSLATRSDKPRRTMHEELEFISRRGEVFAYFTDDEAAASKATTLMPRLPGGKWPIQVINPAGNSRLDDEFIFETLWFGRNSFVIDDAERGLPMLDKFIEMLIRRRESRAHTRQTVHLLWELPIEIPQPIQQRLEILGRATGYTLLIC